MTRTLLVLCVLAGTAHADGPKPSVVSAERAWQAAEHEREPRVARDLWRATAVAFDRAIPDGGRESAYAAVLAWKNALELDDADKPSEPETNKPIAFRPDETAFLHALSVYASFADRDELVGLVFLRASMYRRHHRYDVAIPDFIEIITKHPDHEVGEYAANLLLDSLDRTARYSELHDWVEKMRAMPKLLAGRHQLADLLDELHAQALRH